ncbi:MAG: reverse transcriptase domain-containing protein [Lachnospiraceae bacterium]
MLNELDWELERRGLRFVRYADDCIILVKSRKAARRVMESVTRYIETNLLLKVNRQKSKIGRPKEINTWVLPFTSTRNTNQEHTRNQWTR